MSLVELKAALQSAVDAREVAHNAYQALQQEIARDRAARRAKIEEELTEIYGERGTLLREAHSKAFSAETAARIALGRAELAAQGDPVRVEWKASGVGAAKVWTRTGRTGVLEVREIGTRLPVNRSYGLPGFGELFVRLHKKDGSLSSMIMTTGWSSWKPATWTPPAYANEA